MARFKRIANDFDLFGKSAAIHLKIASLGAGPARHKPEPFSGAQRQRIMEALETLSSGLCLFPSEDEAIARMQRSIRNMEALLSVKH